MNKEAREQIMNDTLSNDLIGTIKEIFSFDAIDDIIDLL